MVPPTASAKRIARSTAPRLATRSTPGSAISTALACVFGAPPNCVDAPENIFERVDSCACVSSPITTSHCMCCPLHSRECCRHPRVPIGDLLEAMCDVEHARLLEIVADELQADRPICSAEPARDRHPVKTREIHADGVDIAKVHLDRICSLGA